MFNKNDIKSDDLFAPVSFGGGGGGGGGDGGGGGGGGNYGGGNYGGGNYGVCTPSDPDGDGISWGGAAGDFAPAGQGYNEGLTMPNGDPLGGSSFPDISFGF